MDEALYERALQRLELMPDDGLPPLVAALPEPIRALLALGPLPDRWECRVCSAVGGARFYGYAHLHAEPSDPRWAVWMFHETPKLHAVETNELYYGPLADQIYQRCIMIYRAAGWEGVAEPANA